MIQTHERPGAGEPIFEGCCTEAEVAAELNIKVQTLRTWASRGRGPARIRVTRGIILYRRAAFNDWLRSREIDPEAARKKAGVN